MLMTVVQTHTQRKLLQSEILMIVVYTNREYYDNCVHVHTQRCLLKYEMQMTIV